MDWGKQELRPRTLCEARGCHNHNRSAPKEPRERSNRFGKRVRTFREYTNFEKLLMFLSFCVKIEA